VDGRSSAKNRSKNNTPAKNRKKPTPPILSGTADGCRIASPDDPRALHWTVSVTCGTQRCRLTATDDHGVERETRNAEEAGFGLVERRGRDLNPRRA